MSYPFPTEQATQRTGLSFLTCHTDYFYFYISYYLSSVVANREGDLKKALERFFFMKQQKSLEVDKERLCGDLTRVRP